jgi:hypothetical protein
MSKSVLMHPIVNHPGTPQVGQEKHTAYLGKAWDTMDAIVAAPCRLEVHEKACSLLLVPNYPAQVKPKFCLL